MNKRGFHSGVLDAVQNEVMHHAVQSRLLQHLDLARVEAGRRQVLNDVLWVISTQATGSSCVVAVPQKRLLQFLNADDPIAGTQLLGVGVGVMHWAFLPPIRLFLVLQVSPLVPVPPPTICPVHRPRTKAVYSHQPHFRKRCKALDLPLAFLTGVGHGPQVAPPLPQHHGASVSVQVVPVSRVAQLLHPDACAAIGALDVLRYPVGRPYPAPIG